MLNHSLLSRVTSFGKRREMQLINLLLTLQLRRRAATTGEVSVKPYPFCTVTPIAYILFEKCENNFKKKNPA